MDLSTTVRGAGAGFVAALPQAALGERLRDGRAEAHAHPRAQR